MRITLQIMTLQELINAKLYDEAIEQCIVLIENGQVTNDQSESLTGYVYLGIIYTHQKKYDQSRQIFDEHYLEIIDECTNYWVGTELVNTYLMFGELKAALNYLNVFLKENPTDFKGLYLKGHILYLKKEFNNSLEALQKAFTINHKNKGLLYNIAIVYQELGNNIEGFRFFELAYQVGNTKAIEEIVKVLFERTGFCDYQNCANPCCKAVKLKGINAHTVANAQSLNSLIISDKRNSCWYKSDEDEKGHWIFECKNFGENNFCNDYENRPQTCRDYPSSIISTRSCCSYKFKLKENSIGFTSASVLYVVLDILEAYKYKEAKEKLLKQNKHILNP